MKFRQFIIWTSALALGVAAGVYFNGNVAVNGFFDFIASAYTKCFKFVAVPTVALAVLTALAGLGKGGTGRIFRKTFCYTLLTSFVAALIALGLFLLISPEALDAETIAEGAQVKTVVDLRPAAEKTTVYGHVLNAIPDNLVNPLLSGNVLSIILIAAAFGVALARLGDDEHARAFLKCLSGLQKVLFSIIRGLIWALPLGIVAFAAQLARDFGGMAVGSIGKYVAVVLGGNLIQFFIVLPLFCLLHGINGYKVMKQMSPALSMALFTKSSVATLPVTISSAENNMKAKPKVARFILPLCCTINMNGCAAFILATSLFVMKCGGILPSLGMMFVWCGIAVLCAIGNAGVPMGCYFLTLALMAGVDGPLGAFGVILPIYTIIDMIETAENVWSDCCICAVVDKAMKNAK